VRYTNFITTEKYQKQKQNSKDRKILKDKAEKPPKFETVSILNTHCQKAVIRQIIL